MNQGEKSEERQKQLKREKDEYFTRMLSALNSQLTKKYFCGETISLIDLVYYNDIVTISYLTNKNLKDCSELKNIIAWYDSIG